MVIGDINARLLAVDNGIVYWIDVDSQDLHHGRINGVVPEYEPEMWNDENGIQYRNNCYNYACNLQTNSYAQPGRASGNMYSSVDCLQVTNGAISDGLAEQVKILVVCGHINQDNGQ